MTSPERESSKMATCGELSSSKQTLEESAQRFTSVKRGEAGRSGFHPGHFIALLWRHNDPAASALMLLWIIVPVAIILAFLRSDLHRWIFGLSYVAIIPCASTLGFATEQLSHKVPRVLGILLETLSSTIIETVLFIVLISKRDEGGNLIVVIKAAILGSVLANMLLCLGVCLFIGGLKHKEQKIHAIIGGTSSDVLLVAGFALLIPGAFFSALYSSAVSTESDYSLSDLRYDTLNISRATAVILMVSFFVYLYHNISSHSTQFDQVLAKEESLEGTPKHEEKPKPKPKLTFSECCVAIAISLGCVCILAYILVREVHPIVHSSTLTENFMGLILVPLVEKLAEHVMAVTKVRKNQINMAIYLCIAPSIQTILFNTALVVMIGWVLDAPMDLNFEVFQLISIVLAIVVVINFLRDETSDYLKGWFLMVVYLVVAVAAWNYPSITVSSQNQQR